jgi:hypothetical protein
LTQTDFQRDFFNLKKIELDYSISKFNCHFIDSKLKVMAQINLTGAGLTQEALMDVLLEIFAECSTLKTRVTDCQTAFFVYSSTICLEFPVVVVTNLVTCFAFFVIPVII